MAEISPNVCGRLYAAKSNLREGSKAFLSIEMAISAINSKLSQFPNGWYCKGGD